MTTVVDQVITVFDAIWKGEGAAKSAALSLEQYQKAGGVAAMKHQLLATTADSTRSAMMNLSSTIGSNGVTVESAAKEFENLGAKLAATEKEMAALIPQTQSAGDKFKALAATGATVVAAIGAVTIALKMTYAAAKAVYGAAEEGAGLRQLRDSFDYLNTSVMKTPNLLGDMVAATKGTMSQASAMQSILTLTAGSSDTLTAAFAKAAPRLAEIAKAANKLNPTLGDTEFMFQSIARGIKRMEPRLLDNLGLNVRMATANKNYAKQLGISVEAMTAEDKVQAALNETLRVGENLISQVGGNVDSATDSYLQLAAATKDYTDAMKESLILDMSGATEAIVTRASAARFMTAIDMATRSGIVGQIEMETWTAKVYAGLFTEAQVLEIIAARMERVAAAQKAIQNTDWFNRHPEGFLPPPPPMEVEDDAIDKSNRGLETNLALWKGIGEEQEKLVKGMDGLITTEDNLKVQRAAAVDTAKNMVKEIDDMIKSIRDLDAATGDYAMQAYNADEKSSFFNESLSSLGAGYTRIGGRTEEQNELLADLEKGYIKAEKSVRDYQEGLKGYGQKQETINKGIKDGTEQMALYSGKIEELKAIQGEMAATNTVATWNQENINKAFLDAADGADANAKELVGLQLAMGMITEAEAEAILKSSNLQEELLRLGTAAADGTDPTQAVQNLAAIQAAIDGMDFSQLMGTAEDERQRRRAAAELSAKDAGLYGSVGMALWDDPKGTLVDQILGDDPNSAISVLDDLRAGAEIVIETSGADTTLSEMDELIERLRILQAGVDIPISTSGSGSEGRRIGGPDEQFGGPLQQGVSYNVGERGPERFVPNVNGTLLPYGQGPSGGQTIINNFNKEAAAISMAMLNIKRRGGIDALVGVS